MHDSDKPMKGYIVYPTYRIIDEEIDGRKTKKSLVYLFGKLENGESFLAMKEYKPYFYISEKDYKKNREKVDKLLKSYNAYPEESTFKNFNDEPVIKIVAELPADVSKLRKTLEDENNINCYEADIRFYQRFLIDHDIKGSLEISGKHKKGKYVDRIYEEPHIKHSA